MQTGIPNEYQSFSPSGRLRGASFAGPVHEDIVEAQGYSTVRTLTAIDKDKAMVRSEIADAVINILKIYVDNDSVPQLIHYLADSLDNKTSHVMAIGSALEYDTVEWARAILDDFELEIDGTEEQELYDYLDIAVSLKEESKTWFNMDGGELSAVRAFSESEYAVAVYAQAVLRLVEDSVYERIPESIPGGGGKWDENYEPTPQPPQENTLKQISVYPNPFNNSFNINYLLEQEAKEVRVEIYDLTGRNILTQKTGRTVSGNLTLNLGECLGIYLLKIYADDNPVHKEKLICIQK